MMLQFHQTRRFLVALIALATVVACDTSFQGTENANLPPQTHTAIDTIIRSGVDRLNSEVTIRWWGDDPDGIVSGYEFSFDGSSWQFTTRNDSIFILSPPAGADTVDFDFQVRAVDNLGAVDPSPARLRYPIKNSQPSILFLPAVNNPVVTFPVVRFSWQAADPDGFDNLNRVELVWNDTTQPVVEIDKINNSATFIATDLQAAVSPCEIYLNNNATPEAYLADGLLLNDTNRLYIRSVDNSDAVSPWAESYPIFVKPVASDILIVNAYNNATAENFYKDQLKNLGITTFDSIRIFETMSGALTQQSPDNLTQARVFALFKTILWFGNNADKSLSLAQKTTGEFFNRGGRMLMAVYVSSTFDEQSQFFDFTPADALLDFRDTTFFMADTSKLQPALAGWPVLQSGSFVGVVKPIVNAIGAETMYTGSILARDITTSNIFNWPGNRNVIIRQRNNGNTTFIFSVLELHRLQSAGLDVFFDKVMNEEFAW